MWSEPELLEQRRFRSVALLEYGKFQLAKQPLVNVVHLGVTGEEHERAPSGNLQQAPDHAGGLGGKLRGAGIGQIGRNVKNGLTLVIEMRGDDQFARMVEPEPLLYVVETGAHGQRRRGQD